MTKGAPRLWNVGGGSDFHENPRKVTVTSRRTKTEIIVVTHGTVDEESGGDHESDREKNYNLKKYQMPITIRIIYVLIVPVRWRPMY